MINNYTVFVLGAGASMPYGYPSGAELKQEVLSILKEQDIRHRLLSMDYFESDIDIFHSELEFSGRYSVDAFLEHRTEFIDIGKAAISFVLTRREDTTKLFKVNDWYHYFYNMLNTPFDDFGKNEVVVFTFNYDRSLEHFLFSVLRNDYGKSEDKCAEKLNQIPIIHLYGQLDPLPWQESGVWTYADNSKNQKFIVNSAKRIKIIHEHDDLSKDSEFTKARHCLINAVRVFFLGFGYDENNLGRLLPNLKGLKDMYGTAKDLEIGEAKRVKKIFEKKNIMLKLGEKNDDALRFLKKYRDVIN